MLLGLQPHPARQPRPFKLHENLTVPLRDRSFGKLLGFLAFWFVTSGMASPFYGVHMLANLKMPYSLAVVYGIVAGVVGLGFQLIWGRLIERIHPKPVLAINFFGISFLPLMWLFARPDFLLPIWIDSVLTGIFWTGVNASLFNIMLGSLPLLAQIKETEVPGVRFTLAVMGDYTLRRLTPAKGLRLRSLWLWGKLNKR